MNGRPAGSGQPKHPMVEWDKSLSLAPSTAEFHGDKLLADKHPKLIGIWYDLWKILSPSNFPEVAKVATKLMFRKGLDVRHIQCGYNSQHADALL